MNSFIISNSYIFFYLKHFKCLPYLLLSIPRREKEEIKWLEHNLKQQLKVTEQFINSQQGSGKKWAAQQLTSSNAQQQQQLNIFHLQFLKYWKNCMLIMNGLNHFHANEIEMLHEIIPDMATDCNIQVFLQSKNNNNNNIPTSTTTTNNNNNNNNPLTNNNNNNTINNINNSLNISAGGGRTDRPSLGTLPQNILQFDRNRSTSTAIPFNTPIDINNSLPDDVINNEHITPRSRPSSPPPPSVPTTAPSVYNLKHFLSSVQRIEYYGSTNNNNSSNGLSGGNNETQGSGFKSGGIVGPRPSEPLISQSTQALVNVNLIKIENLLNEIREENMQSKKSTPLLLPVSVTRPTLGGMMYSIPGNVSNTYYNPDGVYKYGIGSDEKNEYDEQLQKSLESSMRNIINMQQQHQQNNNNQSNSGKHGQSQSRQSILQSNNLINQPKRGSANSLPPGMLSSPMSQRKSVLSSTPMSTSTPFGGLSRLDERLNLDNASQDSEIINDQPVGIQGYHSNEIQTGDIVERLLYVTAPYRPTYSLKEGSNKRQRQLSSTSFNFTEKYVFYGSQILTPIEAQVIT